MLFFHAWLLCQGALAMAATGTPQILVLGDSLSAGYGIDQRKAWVSLLQQRLVDEGLDYRVINISSSGETSAGGLGRLDSALTRYRPAIVIIELGANDGLRGLPLRQMRDNLQQLIERARRAGAEVLLIGMQLPPNYGPRYTRAFHDTYLQLARENEVALLPFLLDGVSEQRELMQADNLHPTAAAQPHLLDNVWAALRPLLNPREDL